MTGTIIFGMSPSGVSWSVNKYLPRRGGNHEWKKFLYAKANDANTVFPIFLAVRGILYLATKSCACSLSQKQRGLKLHNNESSITCRGQGHGASEIRMIFWLESRKMIKRCQFHEFFFVISEMKRESIPYSSRIKTRDSATCDASREYVMDRAPWPQPARLRHHREWFKIVLSLCPLFRFRRPRRRVVKCHKTASNGRLSQSPAVQSKNKESKKGNRVWFKCLEVVTQWLWQFTTGTAKFPCRRLN